MRNRRNKKIHTEVTISGTRIQPKVDESTMTVTPTAATMPVFTMFDTIFSPTTLGNSEIVHNWDLPP